MSKPPLGVGPIATAATCDTHAEFHLAQVKALFVTSTARRGRDPQEIKWRTVNIITLPVQRGVVKKRGPCLSVNLALP